MANHEPADSGSRHPSANPLLNDFVERLNLEIQIEELEEMSDDDIAKLAAEAEKEPTSPEMLEMQERIFENLGITVKPSTDS